MFSRRWCFALASLASAGCAPPSPDEDTPVAEGNTSFAFEPIAVDGLSPRWGAPVAPGVFFGGVDPSMTVQGDVFGISADDQGLHADAVATLDVPRFCACGIMDPGRFELLVIGGRDGTYRDEQSTVLIDLASNEPTVIDDNGAADTPVGCQAFFSSSTDTGYIFGGLASASGFSGDTYRYDPAARAITKLDIVGPAARYDAGIIELADGSTMLIGGMGGDSAFVTFFSDVWRFDPHNETWTEMATTSDVVPEGRRYPWVALAPDESILLYGFGSDSPRGESVLDDMWSFDLANGVWSEPVIEGERPAARGFTYRLAGPPGTAGVLAFGSDAALNVHQDAFVLRVPDAFSGEWR
jgi:hypothetical protein